MKKSECPFCNEKSLIKQMVFDGKDVNLLYNIRDSNKGRMLVVPKRHVTNIADLTLEELHEVFETVARTSEVLKQYLGAEDFNFGWNQGRCAGQMVEHYHVHILPRFEGDDHPKYHLFHSRVKKNLEEKEFLARVLEFRKVFYS